VAGEVYRIMVEVRDDGERWLVLARWERPMPVDVLRVASKDLALCHREALRLGVREFVVQGAR